MANILSLNYPIKLMELYKLFISIFNICPKVFGDKLREVALTDKPQYKKNPGPTDWLFKNIFIAWW